MSEYFFDPEVLAYFGGGDIAYVIVGTIQVMAALAWTLPFYFVFRKDRHDAL
jgi:hypothetical protein